MGLDTTHNCWHGSYGNFKHWRMRICSALGLPPLNFMSGFYHADAPRLSKLFDIEKDSLPIKWECLKYNHLFILLSHSDCDGFILHKDCENIANELDKLDLKDDSLNCKTKQFADGLRDAADKKEDVEFR